MNQKKNKIKLVIKIYYLLSQRRISMNIRIFEMLVVTFKLRHVKTTATTMVTS